MDKNYKIQETTDPSMELRNFKATMDDKNNAVLSWEWPQNRNVKLMLIFHLHDGEREPELEELLTQNHQVVTRDLTAKYSAAITGGKLKFIAVPAFFNEDKGITVCKTMYVTDWLFKKVSITATVTEKPLPLSQFKQATLRVTASDPAQVPLICQILKYAIYEQGRKTGEYPIDPAVMSGACNLFIKKEQIVKYIFDENYSHLFNLRTG
jgi:hypothetical protein